MVSDPFITCDISNLSRMSLITESCDISQVLLLLNILCHRLISEKEMNFRYLMDIWMALDLV